VDDSKDEIESVPVPEPITVTTTAGEPIASEEPTGEVHVPEFIDPPQSEPFPGVAGSESEPEPPMGPPPSDAESESLPPDPEPVSTMPKPPARPQTPNPNRLTQEELASMSMEGLKKLAKKLGIKVGSMPRAALQASIEAASTES
jgi:hypothetical protein